MIKKLLNKAKRTLFTDPKILYSEERHLVSQSFYFSGTNGKAVLLIHGWTSTPYEVRRLGKFLNEEGGYTVLAPMLRGHGTVPKDLEQVGLQEWLGDLTRAYDELKREHQKVFVAGTSIGANLGIFLATQKTDVAGLVLMAMPYRVKLERSAILCARILKLFKNYSTKFYPPTFGVADSITRIIAYRQYPLKSALETFEIIKKTRTLLGQVKQPCFIIQSRHDHVIANNSLEKIFAAIGSVKKEKKYLKKAYHTFISDIKNESIFEEILAFLDEN